MQRLHRTAAIILGALLAFGQQTFSAAANKALEYRFERMLQPMPTAGQAWDLRGSAHNVASAPDGSLWVVEFDVTISGYKLVHFHTDGRLIGQFTVRSQATSFSVAADGSLWLGIYVSENEAYVQHYRADGSLVSQFGTSGKGVGQFSNITSIAVAKDGSIWLIDYPRVQHFTADGQFIAQYAANGSGVGLMDFPTHIALAADDSIWIAGGGPRCTTGCLQHLTVDGQLISEFGTPSIINIAIAADGSVWVAKPSRMYHFSADGRLIKAVNPGSHSNRLTITPNGDVWVAEPDRLLHFSATGDFIDMIKGSPRSLPADITVAKDGSLWLIDSWNAHVQHIDAVGVLIGQFGREGFDAGELYRPSGLAITDDNSVWVANGGSTSIPHFNTVGQVIQIIETAGFHPNKISIAEDGSLWFFTNYVFNLSSGSISHWHSDGRLITSLPRNEAFGLETESGNIAAAKEGGAWVVDTNFNRLRHFNADLSLVKQFGSAGAGVGQFNRPEGIAVAPDGSVWIADTGNNRLQHFNADGEFIAQYGSLGSAAGQFNAPQDVEIAEDGSLWVLDTGNNRIQKFVPKKLPSSPAEYDDKNGLLYLDDVAIDGTHYQATLYQQGNAFRLLTLLPAPASYTPAASFDAATNLLSIPLARAFGQDYQAQFKYLGDSLFQLKTATPK